MGPVDNFPSLGIDLHMLGGKEKGNEVYTLNLTRALIAMAPESRFVLYVPSGTNLPKEMLSGPGILLRRLMINHPLIRLPIVLPILSRVHGLSLLHLNYIAPPLLVCPAVVTIYDISFATFPHFFSPMDRILLSSLVPWSLAAASKVIVPSQHTRRDLLRHYGVPESKIAVVPGGVDSVFHPATDDADKMRPAEGYGIPGPYILTVANLRPRKNLVRLVEAYARLIEEGLQSHSLVVVGTDIWGTSLLYHRVRELGLSERVIFTGFVPDEELPSIYRGADVFVFPSLYEGFGLPPLEAMASGTPVVCSNAASLPEVVGDDALTFDPYETEAITGALIRVLSDSDLRSDLRERGLDRARKFSWEETARQTLAVYEMVLETS